MQIRKYRRGAALILEGSLWSRAGDMLGKVLSHRTVDRRDHAAGGAHRLIFYGFGLLFLGTATITLQYDILEPLFGIRFWQGEFYLIFSLVLDIAGVALLGGLLYMMYRRGWMKLPKLDYARPDRSPGDPDFLRPEYRREDWAFLWTLVIIGFTGYLLEAARLVWLQARPDVWDTRWWSPVGAAIAEGLAAAGLTAHGGGVLRLSLWWFHGLLALAFIALIPFTKVKHIFTAAASLMVRDPKAAQRLPRIPETQKEPGVAKITDFTWKQLLNLDACTKCGRCHEACPARAVGAPLSPRDVILSLREFANATLESGTLPPAAELDVHGKSPGQVAMETLWSCRTCMACVEICPVAVEHVPIIVQMRRKLVEDGAMDPLLTKTLQTIHKTGNSFGESKRKRGSWTKALPFKVKDARKEPVDRPVVRRRLRLLRSAQSESDADLRQPCCTRRAWISAFSTTANRTPATTCAASARRGFTRCWPSPISPRSRARPSNPSSPPIRTPTIRFSTSIPTSAANTRSSTTPATSKRLFADGRLEVTRPLKLRDDLPRPVPSRALQQGVRGAARFAEASGVRARRHGALPRQLFLLRRGRRQDLDSRPRGDGEAGPESHPRGRGDSGPGSVRSELSEGPDHVRGRAQDHRQRGEIRGEGIDRARPGSDSGPADRGGARMKILVAVKQVAALDEDFEIRADGRDVEEEFLIRDLNEWDDYSLEEAVKIKEASNDPVEVVVVSVAPEEADEALRKCLAKGADRAIRVWDDGLEGSDPIAIARVLAAVAKIRGAGYAVRRRAVFRPELRLHRHRHRCIPGLAARRRGELARLCAGGEDAPCFAASSRADCCTRSRFNAPPCSPSSSASIRRAMPRFAASSRRRRNPSKSRRSPTSVSSAGDVGESGSHSRIRRMYIPDKGRAQLIEGDAATQAARLAEIIREFKGDAA